jgi:6-phosphogluconolactonase
MTTLNGSPDASASSDFRLRRRDAFPLVGAAALAALTSPTVAAADSGDDDNGDNGHAAPSRFVYVGTYTKPNTAPGGVKPSEALGIYVFKMDGATGGLSQIQIAENIPNPSWVTLDASLNHLYATSEVSMWNGVGNSGGITAYAIDAMGKISPIDNQPTMGAIPAHVVVDPSGKFALVANYIGANFTALPILSNGGVGPATDVFNVTEVQTGVGARRGPNTGRQEAPHPHIMKVDPAGGFVFGCDLGTDKVWSWTLSTAGKLVQNTNLPYDQVASGSGPRHMDFHPSGKFAYVISEMVSSITAYSYNAMHGTFTWLQTVSTLPPDFTGTSSTAEIIVHKSGNFVYGSNRGHNSIVGFRIDQATGKLSLIGWTSTQGSIPRGFNIDPSGRLMLVGNQNSNTIVPFRINQQNGKLHPTGAITSTPVPVSIGFGRVIT